MKLLIEKPSLKSLVRVAMLACIAVVLHGVEAALPILTAVPGGKLGLANVVTVLVLYCYGGRYAVCVSVLRTVVACLLFTGPSSLIYSLFGALFSFVIMASLLRLLKSRVSPVGLCIAGAAAHNFAQVACAAAMLGNAHIFSYFAPLSFLSAASGFATGMGVLWILKYQSTILKETNT